MKRHVAGGLVLGVAAVIAILVSRGGADPSPTELRANAEKTTALLKERRDVLKQIVSEAERDRREGMVSAVVIFRATIEWLHAELELANDHAARIAIHEELISRLRKAEAALEKDMKQAEPGKVAARQHNESYEFLIVKAARCQAEIDLLREQREKR